MMARLPLPYDKRIDNFEVTSCTPSKQSQTIIGQVEGMNNVINTNDKRLHENTGGVLSTPQQNWSTHTVHSAYSTSTISGSGVGNASGSSVPSSVRPVNPLTQAKGFGEKNGSNAELSQFNATRAKPKTYSKKIFRKLISHGVPHEEASKLCLMSWPDVLKMYPLMIELAPEKRKQQLKSALYIPPKIIPKPTSETENTQDSLSKKDGQESATTTNTTISGHESYSHKTGPLRVGIQNKAPMNPVQMEMVHRYLLKAIIKQFTGGGGPEFLSFTPKQGWIQVTCVDQRSKDWLVAEVLNLKPWPGMLLSIIPEEQLPYPPKVITNIPKSEAGSVKEALDLLRAQNKGLNTGHWLLLHERVEKNKSRTVSFIIDEKSLEILIAQKLKAALGFKIITFRSETVVSPSQLICQPVSPYLDPVSPYLDPVSSDSDPASPRSGIVDLTVPDRRVTSQARNGFGAKEGVIDLTGNDDEVYGKNTKNRSRAKGQASQPKIGSRPTIQNSLRPGNVRLRQGSEDVKQTPVRGSQSQDKNGAHLTENQDKTPNPEEGGSSSWVVAGIVPGLSFFNSGGPPQLTGDNGDSGSGRPSEGTGQDSSLRLSPSKDSNDSDDRLPKSYRLPVKRRKKDRRTDRDRPKRLNGTSPQRGNSQDSQRYDSCDRSEYNQDSGRRATVNSWENSSRGRPPWEDEYNNLGNSIYPYDFHDTCPYFF